MGRKSWAVPGGQLWVLGGDVLGTGLVRVEVVKIEVVKPEVVGLERNSVVVVAGELLVVLVDFYPGMLPT